MEEAMFFCCFGVMPILSGVLHALDRTAVPLAQLIFPKPICPVSSSLLDCVLTALSVV